MLHALLIAATEHAEPSKTPFYVAGSVLAVWAVVLTGIGLTSPSFPTATLAKGVMALTAVLVAATLATAVITG